MKQPRFPNLFPVSLLACGMLVHAPAQAAVVLGSLPAPVLTNHVSSFDEGVDLGAGLDWVKYQGGVNSTAKSGAGHLAVSTLGLTSQATFTPANGYQFTWSGGSPTASGTNRTHTNSSGMADGRGWAVAATGLSSLGAGEYYRLELWGARTDNTPFSIEVYDGETLLGRQTVNGSTAADGSNTDAIYSVVDFTVSGVSDTLHVRFIRDTTHGTVGTVPSVNNAILAIGAWQLTAIPEPSSALLGGLGTLLLFRRRRI